MQKIQCHRVDEHAMLFATLRLQRLCLLRRKHDVAGSVLSSADADTGFA